jgi:hypothetical protein
MLTDHKMRQNLSNNAAIWANTFNWNRSAQESLNILKKLRRTN